MLIRSNPSARSARIQAYISFHYRPERIRYLFEQLRCLAEFDVDLMDVVICTNTVDANEQGSIMQIVAPLLVTGLSCRLMAFDTTDDPWQLPWKHKSLLKEAVVDKLRSFTHFIYAEDDIRFTFHNFCYFVTYRSLLEPHGLIPSFLRYEYNNDKNALYMTDIVWLSEIKDQGVTVAGNRFVESSNPYCAMYVLDRTLAEEYITSRSFDEVSSREVIGWPIADRSAMGMTFESPPPGFISRCVVPVEASNSHPSYSALVHHIPNNYTHQVWTEADKYHFGHIGIGQAFAFV